MRFFLLVALVALFGWLVHQRRQQSYPFAATMVPGGLSFDTYPLPDDCESLRPLCMRRLAYLTDLTDTTLIKTEAKFLLPWVAQKAPAMQGPGAVALVAVKPGTLRLAAPTHAFYVAFVRRSTGDEWRYVHTEDFTKELNRLFKGL